MALEWVLTGGEDHALVAAFPPGTALPARWRVIGEVREGAGVTVDGAAARGARRLAALPLILHRTSPDPHRIPLPHRPGSMIMKVMGL